MTETIEATFDGKIFRPETPVNLKPNTRVRLIIETDLTSRRKQVSFLQTAKALNLEGPPDWSENIDEYLYGIDKTDE